MEKGLLSPIKSVSIQVSVAPDDAPRGETGCAVNPMINVNLSGDRSSALLKPNVRPIGRMNLSKLRLSGLSKNVTSSGSQKFAFKPPGFVDVVRSSNVVGPRPSSDSSKPNTMQVNFLINYRFDYRL